MKVRSSRAGEDQPPNIPGEHNHSHEREGDKYQKVRASPAGEDRRGMLAVVEAGYAPTYFTPEGAPGAVSKVIKPGKLVTILRSSESQKALGDRAVMVLGPDGDVGWVWLAQLRVVSTAATS